MKMIIDQMFTVDTPQQEIAQSSICAIFVERCKTYVEKNSDMRSGLEGCRINK